MGLAGNTNGDRGFVPKYKPEPRIEIDDYLHPSVLREKLEKYGQEACRNMIKEGYEKLKQRNEAADVLLLKDVTYAGKYAGLPGYGYGSKEFTELLDAYIRAYNIRLKKDATLEEAVRTILGYREVTHGDWI